MGHGELLGRQVLGTMGAIGKELRRSERLPSGQVGAEEEVQSFILKGEGSNQVVQKNSRGGGIIKCVVPAPVGMNGPNPLCQFKVLDQISKGELSKTWPCSTGHVQGVDPRSELVTGKGPEKPFLCSMSMGDKNSIR